MSTNDCRTVLNQKKNSAYNPTLVPFRYLPPVSFATQYGHNNVVYSMLQMPEYTKI